MAGFYTNLTGGSSSHWPKSVAAGALVRYIVAAKLVLLPLMVTLLERGHHLVARHEAFEKPGPVLILVSIRVNTPLDDPLSSGIGVGLRDVFGV